MQTARLCNRRVTRIVLLAAVLLLTLGVLTVPAGAIDSQAVTAEGVAAILSDKAQARDEALRDAYRRAVETVGVQVDSRTEVKDFELFYDRIITQSSGYVRSYKIVREWEADGMYHVLISAEVVRGDIRNDVSALAYLIDMMGNPRVMVLIEERNLGMQSVTTQSEDAIIRKLRLARYNLVDSKRVQALKNSDTAKAAMAGDTNAAIALGERLEADIIVTGAIESKPLTSRQTGSFTFYSCTAYSSLRVISAGNGTIIISDTGSSTEADLSSEAAGMKAIAKRAEEVGNSIIWEIPKHGGGPSSTRTIQLVVKNCDYAAARALVSAIKEMRNVVRVDLRTLDAGIAVIDVELSGSATIEDLAMRLEQLRLPRLKITGFTRDRLDLTIVK